MISSNTQPHGSWISPITGAVIVSDTINLDEVQLHGEEIYWIEKRPGQNGRCVIVKYVDNRCLDMIPKGFSARSRVHEYGGGCYLISDVGIFFVNDHDQNIYLIADDEKPKPITHVNGLRYSNFIFDSTRQQLIAVCEDHRNLNHEPINALVAINILTGTINTLQQGFDFYSNPCLSADGNQFAWLCWNHPNMPWDGTELWHAQLDKKNTLTNKKLVAGADNVSIFQPQWSDDGYLYFVSDENGWWNLYRNNGNSNKQLTNKQCEFGLPQWVFAQSSYAFINDKNIICFYIDKGKGQLALLNIASLDLRIINVPWSSFSSLHANTRNIAFIAASETQFPEIIRMDADLNNLAREPSRLMSSCHTNIDHAYFSYGETMELTTRHGDTLYAIYYAPTNPDFIVDSGGKPPLIVITHGGPTGMSTSVLDLRKQFWTSRGFALLDVNYSGSTGYGRRYRRRLEQHWGIRDAEDCCDAAQHLVNKGLADPQRLIIKGGSAGGYTVLCALTFHDTFKAGASYYGISELETLVKDTHKFESRYLDKLVGPYPECAEEYKKRSPIFHVDQLNCPVIFFQGTEDKVVPKQQAEKMFEALKQKGIPVAYVSFSGEQHGFRKAETIQAAIEAEYYFYLKIFGLSTDSSAGANNTVDAPVNIENL